MDIIKKKKVWIIGVITFLFIMYVFPNFVNLNTSKSYLENKIEEIIGFKTEIKGDVSFTILPRPSLILRNVEISSFDENKKNSVFINAPQIFINTSIFNLFKKNLVINKIGMINSIFHADTYKKSGYENLDNLLNGKMFKHITIKNSRLVFKDTFIYQINMDFSSQKDNKLN